MACVGSLGVITGNIKMSYILLMKEKNSSGVYPSYHNLDHDREVVYEVYRISYDMYGNRNQSLLLRTESLTDAKRFLRSCKLIGGILIDE